MQPKTTVARLRIEVITRTRIVRRIVDVSTKTGLGTVARIIRTARGWWEDRHYRFKFEAEEYGDGTNRGAGVRQAKGKALGGPLGEHTSFDFVHDITAGTSQTIQVESVSERDEPETAFPTVVETAGILAVEDLTPNDGAHRWVTQAADPDADDRNHAIEMLLDEGQRAELEQHWVKSEVNGIRIGRQGPLRSHQSTNRFAHKSWHNRQYSGGSTRTAVDDQSKMTAVTVHQAPQTANAPQPIPGPMDGPAKFRSNNDEQDQGQTAPRNHRAPTRER